MMIALIGFNANAAIYIVGDSPFAGWHTYNGTEMTDNGDGTYSYKATISGSVWFVFADQLTEGTSDDWTTFNPNYRIGPTNGDETVTVDQGWVTTQKAGGDNGAYKFTGSGNEYTFTFDLNTMKFKVEGIVDVPTTDTYTVAGSPTTVFGSSWSATDTNNDMTLVNGLYTWSRENVEVPLSGFAFKVVYNHDWGTAYPSSNYVQSVDKHGYYDVVITFNADTKEVICTATLKQEIDDEGAIYTIAGAPAALFGTEWDPSLVANEMTKGQDGIYTWTKNNVTLNAGNVEFKVVLGHDWGVEYPSSNYVATIEENGNYDVEITFNEDTKDITFTATAAVVVDDFYTVAGAPESLFGEEWNPEYAANNMVLDPETGLYTWTREDVELAANTFIEFKVVKNANWSTCWPENNYEYTCPADGIYDLTITYNPETNEVTFTCVASGEEPPVEMVYTVVGPEAVFGVDWDATAVANDMVKGEDDVYTWTKENVTLNGNFSFKVVGNHDYAVYEWPMGYGNNYVVNVEEEAIYTIVITFDPEAAEADRITCTLTKTGDIAPVEHVYTVAGSQILFGSNWDPNDEANNLIKGEDGIYTWTKSGVEFALNDEVEFKIVQDHGWTYAWPSSNWYWKCEDAGKYDVVITFDPTADDMNKITFTATKQGAVVGDLTGEGEVTMDDLTALINYMLTGNGEGMNLDNAAACDGEAGVGMDDLTALINFLTTGSWPTPPAVEHVYTVAGTENLFGSNWNPADEANDMVKGNDGIYTWTKENVEFTEYATIEFKVVEDHSWDNSAWPSSNWWAEITEPGMYNFVITFDPTADDMSKITYTATKQVVE